MDRKSFEQLMEAGEFTSPVYVAGDLTGPVFVCQARKDADALHALGYDAAVSGNGWPKPHAEQLRDMYVGIMQGSGEQTFANKTAAALHGIAKGVQVLDVAQYGSPAAMISRLGTEKSCEAIAALIEAAKEWEPPPARTLEIISATDLQKANLPPVKFIVEDILPEGTSLISAASKIGKSWMVLDLGLCVSAGIPFMGHKTNRCGVLYLALEDSLNRLQERMKTILAGNPAPQGFDFSTAAPKMDDGLLDLLSNYLKQHPNTKLIIIDTLQKIRGQALPRESGYAQDYREMETIKGFMDKRSVSVQFVHHNRKMRDDDDPFNMISGTNGIMGAADTIWTITKDKRTDGEATLHITGRDVRQSDTVIRFDGQSCRWQAIGEADWLAEQRARQEYNESPVVMTIKKLLEQSPAHRWDGTAKELMEAGKYIAHTYLAVDNQKLGYVIRDLEKPLFEYDKIVHSTAKTSGNGGKKHHFYYQDFGEFEELGDQEKIPWTDT